MKAASAGFPTTTRLGLRGQVGRLPDARPPRRRAGAAAEHRRPRRHGPVAGARRPRRRAQRHERHRRRRTGRPRRRRPATFRAGAAERRRQRSPGGAAPVRRLSVAGTDDDRAAVRDRRRLLSDLIEPGDNWTIPAHRIGDGADLLAATGRRASRGSSPSGSDRSTGPAPVEGLAQGEEPPPGRCDDRRVHRRVGQPGVDVRRAAGRPTRRRSARVRRRRRHRVRPGDARVAVGAAARLDDDDCPFDPPPPSGYGRDATWVEPTLRATIEIAEFTNEGLVAPRQLRRADRRVTGGADPGRRRGTRRRRPARAVARRVHRRRPRAGLPRRQLARHDPEAHGRGGARRDRAAVGRRPDHVVVGERAGSTCRCRSATCWRPCSAPPRRGRRPRLDDGRHLPAGQRRARPRAGPTR